MNGIIEDILSHLANANKEQSQFWSRKLALIFELKNGPKRNPSGAVDRGFYEGLLSKEEYEISLTDADEVEAVNQACRLINEGYPSATLFFAIGKSNPKAAFDSLYQLVFQSSFQLKGNELYQALVAIENCFDGVRDPGFASKLLEALQAPRSIQKLESIIESDDDRAAEVGARIKRAIMERPWANS